MNKIQINNSQVDPKANQNELIKISNINRSVIDKVITNRNLAKQNSENAFSNLHIRHVDKPD